MRALDTGADDFMVKPFKIKELVARINAVDRRKSKPFVDRVYARGAVEINRDLHTVYCRGREVHLRKKEFDLFEMLFVNLNNVLTRTAIFEKSGVINWTRIWKVWIRIFICCAKA